MWGQVLLPTVFIHTCFRIIILLHTGVEIVSTSTVKVIRVCGDFFCLFLGFVVFLSFPFSFFYFSPWSTNIFMLPWSYVRPPTSGLRSQDLRQEKLPVLMEQKIVEHYFPSLLDTWWECRDWQMRAASLLEQRGSKVVLKKKFKSPLPPQKIKINKNN